MGSLIPWLEVTIPGVIYLTAFAFALLCLYKVDTEKLNRLYDKAKPIFPYLSVIIVFTSYIIGLMAQFIMEWLIGLKYDDFKFDADYSLNFQREVPEGLARWVGGGYANLIMIRHLILSVVFLASFSSLWRKRIGRKVDKRIFVVWLFLLVILSGAYLIHRSGFKELKEKVDKRYHISVIQETQQQKQNEK